MKLMSALHSNAFMHDSSLQAVSLTVTKVHSSDFVLARPLWSCSKHFACMWFTIIQTVCALTALSKHAEADRPDRSLDLLGKTRLQFSGSGRRRAQPWLPNTSDTCATAQLCASEARRRMLHGQRLCRRLRRLKMAGKRVRRHAVGRPGHTVDNQTPGPRHRHAVHVSSAPKRPHQLK